MTDGIKLGYELGTGAVVCIQPSHLIVTGITQLSGKTTTLEALIKRSGLKAIVFKTKIGERSFSEGTEVPGFFRDRSDYEFVRSLIEAYAKEKLFLEKGTLMTLCKDSGSLLDVKRRVDEKMLDPKLRGLQQEIYTRLQHYLDNLIPQIQKANLSKTLYVHDGVNIMNLDRFEEAAQSLIIQSVAEEVLNTMTGVILVIPEAWKFIPQKYNNPCKRVVESFIRQGAANKNYIWIDSQDMAGVDKAPLKQLSTWILGYQTERNEVKHTLDQIGLEPKDKPTVQDVMTLKTGTFILSSYEGVRTVYVQPVWMTDDQAERIAKGEEDLTTVKRPESLVPYAQRPALPEPTPIAAGTADIGKVRKDMIELRADFFNKIEELATSVQRAHQDIRDLKHTPPAIDEQELASRILQKLPLQRPSTTIDEAALTKRILAQIPQTTGSVTYTVAPLEKLRKNFLQEAKEKILGEIRDSSKDVQRLVKYLESRGVGVKYNELVTKCFFWNINGTQMQKARDICKEAANREFVRIDAGNSAVYASLKGKITAFLSLHGATEAEIQAVYDHIIHEVLS